MRETACGYVESQTYSFKLIKYYWHLN